MTRTAYVLLLSLGLAACVSVHVSTLSTFASADGRFKRYRPGRCDDGHDSAEWRSVRRIDRPCAVDDVAGWSAVRSHLRRWDPSYLTSKTMEAGLAEAARANLDTTGGTLVDKHATTVAGLPGLEQRIAAGPVEYVFRFVFVGNRLYSLSATGSDRKSVV